MQRDKDSLPVVTAAALGSAASVTIFLLAPLVVGRAMSAPLSWDAEAAASLVSLYFFGYLGACLSAGLWAARFNWRILAVVSTLMLAMGIAATALVTEPAIAGGLFAMAGLGAGILYTLTTCVVAESHDPTRNFGIKIVAEQIIGALMILALPLLVGGSLKALLLPVAAIVLMLGITGYALPRGSVAMAQAADPAARANGGRGLRWTALLALFVFFGTLSGFWAFIERIGAEQGLGAKMISIALAIGVICGGAGAFLAALLGERFGRSLPVLVSAVVLVIAIAVLVRGSSQFGFVLALGALDLAWNLSLVYMLSTSSSLDMDGRLAPLLASALAAGAACGPMVAASAGTVFSGDADFSLLPSALLAVGGVLFAAALFRFLDGAALRLHASDKIVTS